MYTSHALKETTLLSILPSSTAKVFHQASSLLFLCFFSQEKTENFDNIEYEYYINTHLNLSLCGVGYHIEVYISLTFKLKKKNV